MNRKIVSDWILGRFTAIKTRWRTRRSHRKCDECRASQPRADLHRIQIKKYFRLPLPQLIVRNFFSWIMGYKPAHVTKRAWLFGHEYKKLETKKLMRWVCFDCYIRLLTPQEYATFRSAYYDDLVMEDGREKATAMVAHMDAIFTTREDSA